MDNANAALHPSLAVESPSGVCSSIQKQWSWFLRRIFASCPKWDRILSDQKWIAKYRLSVRPSMIMSLFSAAGSSRDIGTFLNSYSYQRHYRYAHDRNFRRYSLYVSTTLASFRKRYDKDFVICLRSAAYRKKCRSHQFVIISRRSRCLVGRHASGLLRSVFVMVAN
jgi:hypothetical protein